MVAPGQRTFIIAEAGVNHCGDPLLAIDLVHAAAKAGADAVKFQTFRTDALVTSGTASAPYQLAATGKGSQADLIRALELPRDALLKLFAAAGRAGIELLSTPFDEHSARVLAELGVRRFKVGSGELTHHPLLRHLASYGKPMFLSTGMATLGEIEEALEAIRQGGNCEVILLHCVSAYPTPIEEANIRAIDTLRHAFGLPVGFSDHTLGVSASLAAVARGASVIEKHFTLDRSLPGPDHQLSLTPDEFREMVRMIREIEACLGDGHKRLQPSEKPVKAVVRRCLVAAADIPAGAVLHEADLAVKRPEQGLPPRFLPCVVGRRARRALTKDEPLTLASVNWDDA